MIDTNPIIAFLLEDCDLEIQDVDELLAKSTQTGKGLVSILRAESMVSPDQLAKLIAMDNSIEFVDLSSDMIDQMAVRLVPSDMARRYNLIPVRIEKDALYVAMSSPLNLSVRDAIAAKTGYRIVPLAATDEAVAQAISFHFNLEAVTRQDIVQMRLKQSSADNVKAKKTNYDAAASTPTVRLVDSIIAGGINSRASDIHIEPQYPDMRVRYRVDGILIEALEIPASAQAEIISHIKILADMDISEKRLPQDGHICFTHQYKDYDLRIASLPATSGEKIVIRILDNASACTSLAKIAPDQNDFNMFQSLIENPYGIILLTGPTGSGKTTTLYSLLQEINSPDRNIVTVEDPVEYRLDGVTQVQVKPDIGLTFASCLRNILRQDPDVILIGEIRDNETAEIAISAAQTGHLVFSTLHTNDAAGAISRLVSLGIPPFQVASALLGTVAQRLVRRICPKCRIEYQLSEKEKTFFRESQEEEGPDVIYKGSGCEFCRNTGYIGRAGIYEILAVSQTIREMIVDEKSTDDIRACAVAEGMRTLKMQGVAKALKGDTTLKELYRVVDMREL